jgi:hypothetical protein
MAKLNGNSNYFLYSACSAGGCTPVTDLSVTIEPDRRVPD